ncbi:PRC-barrel domain-containing protein [Falsiroseomonas sp. CW058]|uniref:PRC-barrel domain-containing protein n=1 Tax=Falsiroseomonas sp. CW058 TaxID=3388664 RepID=UPI003D31008B
MIRLTAAAFALGSVLALPALAQAPAPATGATTAIPGTAGGGPITSLTAGQMTAGRLMDLDVHGSDGTRIGEVEDLVLDPASGRIVAIVIEVAGTLGIGEREVALPLESVRMEGDRRVTVGMTREQLRELPRFERR